MSDNETTIFDNDQISSLDDIKDMNYVFAGSLEHNAQVSGDWAGGEEITASKMNNIDRGIKNVTNAINFLANTTIASIEWLAAPFSENSYYMQFSIVTYHNKIYMCNEMQLQPGEFNPNQWSEVNIDTVIDARDEILANAMNSMDNHITRIDADVEAIKGKVLPEYWKTYIATKAASINALEHPPVGNGVRFAFITDAHLRKANGKARNAGYSPLLLKYLRDHCNLGMIVFGGDAITGDYSTKDAAIADLSYFREMFSDVWPYMYCVYGNHDYGNNGSPGFSGQIDKKNLYNMFIRDKEEKYERVNPVYGSYVVDNPVEKVRFLFLNINEGNNLTQQTDFFCNAMNDTPSGWTIIIFDHFSIQSSGTAIFTKLVNDKSIVPAVEQYNTRGSYKGTDFSNAGATVACIIGGHCHYDGCVKTESGVPIIATTADMYDGLTGRVRGTITEHAFDIYDINTSTKTINITRIGAGDDRTITYGL